MKVPITWLKDFVDIEMPVEELARVITLAGLEVEEIRYVGLPLPPADQRQETKISGIAWDPEKIVVGAVLEVMPHPNADRLVLCRLDDGEQEHTVLTGAPNLFPYLGQGEISPPLKVAYAREGSQIIDAYTEEKGTHLTTLKRRKIRGVESYSMACSEKELGISDQHEGIIILDDDAQAGAALVDYMGDAVLDIAVTPNMARVASILGVAREVAALTGFPLKMPSYDVKMEGKSIQDQVKIEITDPDLNPRFVLGLIEDVERKPSPYWVQRRLRLAGTRPIDCLVDATNYTMLEIGEPLHAFDFDTLKERAGGKTPKIITRRAESGETITTLDGISRELQDFTVLVTDTSGPLSLAGVMGGAETEVEEDTKNILLEGASWNYVNVRRTVSDQNLPSEAAYRFERGVHPEVAPLGVRRCLEWMRKWTGGTVAEGLVDAYPLPPEDPAVSLTEEDVKRWLGISLSAKQIGSLLEKLEFEIDVKGDMVSAVAPPHRLDIGLGMIGKADLMEEIARIYGYDRIPATQLAAGLPPQIGNRSLEMEETIRDRLVGLGLQEIVTYRITSPEAESRLFPTRELEAADYVRLANPITSDKTVLRQNLLSNTLEIVEKNSRNRKRIALFEIGPVFIPAEDQSDLPEEYSRLVLAVTGKRQPASWQDGETGEMDFYDLKGVLEKLADELHLESLRFVPAEHESFHPGKCAAVYSGEAQLGVMGEIHPLVRDQYDLPDAPLLAAEFKLESLLEAAPGLFEIEPIPVQPPVLEDLAIVVDEKIPARKVEDLIRQTGGSILADLRLFDVYRGEQVGSEKKSLAYSLIYQHPDRTLTDKEVASIRKSIVTRLEKELGASLRS
jgi:phenylalanyl-tRNA synthetase beta chain